MLWRARRLRCGARPDLSGAWCSLPRSYVFHEDGNSSLMSVFIALMSAPGLGLPEVAAGHEVGARPGFLAGDGARWSAGRVPQCDVRHNSLCIQLCTESNIARRRDDHARGWLRPAGRAAFCGPWHGRVAALARRGCAAGMRYPGYALGGGSLSRAAGDWLSGRAPRSHRGGHWFDPSIAHQPDLGVRPGHRLFAPVSSYFADETSGVSGRNFGRSAPRSWSRPSSGRRRAKRRSQPSA